DCDDRSGGAGAAAGGMAGGELPGMAVAAVPALAGSGGGVAAARAEAALARPLRGRGLRRGDPVPRAAVVAGGCAAGARVRISGDELPDLRPPPGAGAGHLLLLAGRGVAAGGGGGPGGLRVAVLLRGDADGTARWAGGVPAAPPVAPGSIARPECALRDRRAARALRAGVTAAFPDRALPAARRAATGGRALDDSGPPPAVSGSGGARPRGAGRAGP